MTPRNALALTLIALPEHRWRDVAMRVSLRHRLGRWSKGIIPPELHGLTARVHDPARWAVLAAEVRKARAAARAEKAAQDLEALRARRRAYMRTYRARQRHSDDKETGNMSTHHLCIDSPKQADESKPCPKTPRPAARW